MGLSKLREWVGTVTGKGDRWGRDSVGRSAPAFLAASATALPHLPALHGERQADVICGHCLLRGRPTAGRCVSSRPVPGGESAGCVRLQCLFCGLCFACLAIFACHAHCPQQFLPPFISSCPRSSLLCPRPFHFCFVCPRSCPCAPGSSLF